MKKSITVLFLPIAAIAAIAPLVNPLKNWNDLIKLSPEIVIVRCTSTVGSSPLEKTTAMSGGVPSDIEVLSVLKGAAKPGPSHMITENWPYQGEKFLLFANYENDQLFTGYNVEEVIPLSHYFQTSFLAGKTLEQQIQLIMKMRQHDIKEEVARDNEEEKRLEQGLTEITNALNSASKP